MLLVFEGMDKNANHYLLSCIFRFKLCKCTRFSDCPLSPLEEFLALIALFDARPLHTLMIMALNYYLAE